MKMKWLMIVIGIFVLVGGIAHLSPSTFTSYFMSWSWLQPLTGLLSVIGGFWIIFYGAKKS